jgi:hypothetical protein
MGTIMLETAAAGTIVTTGEVQPEFSQEYSKGELEEMGSRELLDGYARAPDIVMSVRSPE